MQDLVAKVLGRPERPLDYIWDLQNLIRESARILVTGSQGSLGREVIRIFDEYSIEYLATDVDSCDVTLASICREVVSGFRPSHILHLAADKHAPIGEIQPEQTLAINALGTTNIVNAAKEVNARVILASTCKACDPETVYGASKLIAERIVLNNGGSVARFFNVIETAGNVFEIWDSLPETTPIRAAECHRYFISKNEAVSLLVKVLGLSAQEPGRYILDPGSPHYVPDVASRLFPGRQIILMRPRRGDRVSEPLKAFSEVLRYKDGGLIVVSSAHDIQET